MKLEIEVDDLTEFISALNNSIVALNDIYILLFISVVAYHQLLKRH